MRETGLVGLGSDVALIVSPLVHGEDVNLGAVNLEVVDQLSQRDVGLGLGVAQDQSDLAASLRGFLDAGEQGGDQNRMGVHHNLDLEIRIGMLLQVLAADLAQALADFAILKGNVIAGDKVEVGCGIEDDVLHRTRSPFKMTCSIFIQESQMTRLARAPLKIRP